MKKLNKKGFTLTELIVVIVIIGILAVVLIPTLTGYINRAKESAAEQEATSYITAYNTWKLETSNEIQDLESFKEYCIEMELVDESKVDSTILDVTVAKENMSFTIKASNGYYVTFLNGDLTATKDSPIVLLRNTFNEKSIEPKLNDINSLFKNNEASLVIKPINSDGSYNVEVLVMDKDASPLAAVDPVKEAIKLIKEAKGESVIITPIIDGKELSARDYKNTLSNKFADLPFAVEEYFPLDFSGCDDYDIAWWAAATIVYSDDFNTFDEWDAEITKLITQDTGKLEQMIKLNLLMMH